MPIPKIPPRALGTHPVLEDHPRYRKVVIGSPPFTNHGWISAIWNGSHNPTPRIGDLLTITMVINHVSPSPGGPRSSKWVIDVPPVSGYCPPIGPIGPGSLIRASYTISFVDIRIIHGNLRYPPQSYPPNK